MKLNKETLDKLEAEGWEFRPSFAMPDFEFKSPRMSGFDVLLHNEATEEGLRKEELQCLLVEIEEKLDNGFKLVKDHLLNQMRLLLERNQTPPQQFNVSFDMDLTK